MANHVLKEPIPKKIADFRHHPLYVLQRHLKRNEMLISSAVHVSALTSGKGMNLKTEHVYKRKDVVHCYSARDWFRRGRIIKVAKIIGDTDRQEGEQPVKHAGNIPRRPASSSDEGEDISVALYSETQTELYIPPPIENGIVPKNTYGNIDVYTPSMIPTGGVHLTQSSIAIAAQFAGVDYADAVTGFDFVRNKATARLNGIIVAKENVEGLLEVWEGMMERVRGEEERLKTLRVLERWKRFFIALGIRRRLNETHGKLEDPAAKINDDEKTDEDIAGGFFSQVVRDRIDFASGHRSGLETEETNITYGTKFTAIDLGQAVLNNNSLPRFNQMKRTSKPDRGAEMNSLASSINAPAEDEGGGFVADEPQSAAASGGSVPQGSESDGGGGFMTKDDETNSDGFIYEDEDGIL